MFRSLTAASLLLALAALAVGQDTVRYNDRLTKKNDIPITGTILEESPAGIKMKVKDGKEMVEKVIPTGDIVVIQYKTGSEVSGLEFRGPFSKEERARLSSGKARTKLLAEALVGFTALEGKLKGDPKPRRYVQFKIAEVTAVLAQDDVNKRDDAIKLLTTFKTEHPTSWSIVPALKTLARLQEEAGNTDEARKSYEELAGIDGVPKELKQESEILVGRLLLRANRFADAQKRLEKLATSMSDGETQKPFVRAYLAEAKIAQNKIDGVDKELAAVVKVTSDGRLRGVAFNLIGDLHLKAGRSEEAFWSYLKVDVMYNDDIDAQAKALYHLSSLFDKVKKDPARGKDCLRRLRDKRFAGTVHQKLAGPDPDEKKDEPKKVTPKKDKETR